ncbi:hypothetical protein, partial [Sinisalibacter lacisalsi]|uniref:hypothetical protein n=1 Tax=Sinisalibacter lacisalsi TaxID=1526570 RepID=UPI001E4E62DE
QRPKPTSTQLWKLKPWPRSLHQPASGKPGAVQVLIHPEIAPLFVSANFAPRRGFFCLNFSQKRWRIGLDHDGMLDRWLNITQDEGQMAARAKGNQASFLLCVRGAGLF